MMDRHKARREWYKQHGICVNCGQRNAMDGKVLCWECSNKRAEYRESLGPRPEAQKEQIRQCQQRLYAKRKAMGVCVRCGNPNLYDGTLRCMQCTLESRRYGRERQRKKPKKAWREHGLCLDCGAPRMEGKAYCPSCYERRRALAVKAGNYDRKMHPFSDEINIEVQKGKKHE